MIRELLGFMDYLNVPLAQFTILFDSRRGPGGGSETGKMDVPSFCVQRHARHCEMHVKQLVRTCLA